MPDPAPTQQTVRLVDPDGQERDVPVESAGSLLQDSRWRVAATADTLGRLTEQAREVDYGGTAGAIQAGAAGLARGATLGLSDVAARALGGEDAAFDLGQLREEHAGVSFGSELAGAVAPALFSGGASLPAGLAARAGQGAARAAGGGLRGVVAGGALEGGLYGLGSGVTELSLSEEPLTVERAVSTLSSHALFGAGAGAAGAAALKGAELGLSRAKGAVDSWLLQRSEARAMKAVSELETAAAAEHAAIGPETDVTLLDRKGLRVARAQELDAIKAAQAPEREEFVDALKAAHDERKAMYDWLAIVGDRNEEKAARDAAAIIFKTDRKIRDVLNDRVGLSERPDRALGLLRTERQALGHLSEVEGVEGSRYFDRVRNAPEQVRKELLANEIPGFVVGKGGISPTSPVIDDIVAREVQSRFPIGPDGLRIPPRDIAGFLDGSIGRAIERNDRLQQQLIRLSAPPTSPRLDAIDAAEHALGGRTPAPKAEPEPSLGGAVLSAVAPFAGPVGAAASGVRALAGLRKAAAAAGEKAAQAGSKFLDVATKATRKAQPYAPVLATKVLTEVRFADEDPKVKQPTTLPELFKARSTEIKQQIEVAPDGSFQMRAAARLRLAAKFDGIRQSDPIGADRLETLGARRIEYLASIIPRRPDIGGAQVGPDRWVPSDMEMRAWARSVAAVEDPGGVLERAADGRVVPEEAAALRAVYPEMLAEYSNNISMNLSSLRSNLPYKRRLALSILTGVPVDAAMTPLVLNEIQTMYATEPGTAGGTQAPRPEPQFGSVRADKGTPSQRREGLATT